MEKEMQKRLPPLWLAAIVLIGFLVLAFGFTIKNISIQLAIFAGWFLAIFAGRYVGYSYTELQKSATDGISKGMDALLILLAVGMLVGTWISGGIVPSIIYYGLKVIHPSVFLLATLIICAITSLSTGTSWGTAGTAGIAMMGIGAGLGIPAPVTAGAVLSGAYFGDKLSPLSDSCILSSTMANVELVRHIKGLMPVSIAGFIATCIAFTVMGFKVIDGSADMSQIQTVMTSIDEIFNISLFNLLPMVIVIGLLVLRMPSIPVICLGAVIGIIWGILFQGLEPIAAVQTAWSQIPQNTGLEFIDNILSRGGMNSMLGSVAVIILGLGFGGLLGKVGILTVISQLVEKFIIGATSLTAVNIVVAFFGNLFGSAMYVSLILTPQIMAKKYDEMGYDRRVLSRNSEVGGTLTSGMVPWSDNGIYMAALLGVPVLQYVPYMWLSFFCIGFAVLFAALNMFMWRVEPKTANN